MQLFLSVFTFLGFKYCYHTIFEYLKIHYYLHLPFLIFSSEIKRGMIPNISTIVYHYPYTSNTGCNRGWAYWEKMWLRSRNESYQVLPRNMCCENDWLLFYSNRSLGLREIALITSVIFLSRSGSPVSFERDHL